MDPLSMIASVIGIAHGVRRTLEVILRIYKANSELTALHNEISDLTVVLGELQSLLSQTSSLPSLYRPSTNLTNCVQLTSDKLEILAQQVSSWKAAADQNKNNVEQLFLKVLRVPHKAKIFKEEVIKQKWDLASLFSVLNLSTSSRIEVDVKQILLNSEKQVASQVQLRNELAHWMSLNSAHTEGSSEGSNRIPSQHGDSQPSSSQIVAEPETEIIQEDSIDLDDGVRAFHSNHSVLFESSHVTALTSIGIRVAQFPRLPCTPWCSCKCHIEQQRRSPSMLDSLLGALFIGYSGLPLTVADCDQSSCHLRAKPFAYVTYMFPRWFLARAVSFVMTTTPLAGPIFSLKVNRTVPGDAEIFTCAKQGNVDRIKELFENGSASPFDIQFDSGVTALHYATTYQHIHVCSFLLQCNADPFWEDRGGVAAADNAWGRILARSLPVSKAKVLRSMFSETECIERRDFTILHKIVVGLLHMDLESQLSASTAEINLVDINGRTPLSFAAQQGNAEAVSTLLRFGADIQKPSNCGNSPLHHAVTTPGSLSCVQRLLLGNADGTADVNAVTGWNQTPLHYVAAYTDNASLTGILLEAGANLEIRDLDGLTALDWAAMLGNSEVAKVLLNHNASVTNTDKYGNTVLVHSISGNRHSILEHFAVEPLCTRIRDTIDADLAAKILFAVARNADIETMTLLARTNYGLGCSDLFPLDRRSELVEVLRQRQDMTTELQVSFDAIFNADTSSVHDGSFHDNNGNEPTQAEATASSDDSDSTDCWQDAVEFLLEN